MASNTSALNQRWSAVDGMLGREIIGHVALLHAGMDDVVQSVEHLMQRVVALRTVLAHQNQVGSHEGPFLITNVTGISPSVYTVSLSAFFESA